MKPADERSPEHLIDLYFRDLESAEDAADTTQPAADPELAARIERVLRPLDTWATEEPSADLADRIVARIEHASPLEIVASAASLSPETNAPATRPRFPLSLVESLAVAACIALVAIYYLPGIAQVRSQKLKALCGGQLASVYRGLMSYSEANSGELPAVPERSVNWLHQPNRRHLAPALRLRFIDPNTLLCPTSVKSADARKLDVDEISRQPQQFLARVNFRFYSLQNRSGPVPTMNQPLSLPLLADPNPMFDNGQFNPDATNSLTHDGDGQNVLFLNGSTQFLKTPVVGSPADHIWRIEHVDSYEGTETQTSATDAFLIP